MFSVENKLESCQTFDTALNSQTVAHITSKDDSVKQVSYNELKYLMFHNH